MNTTNEWVISTDQPGYKVKEIKHGNCTIQIFRPLLDDKEKAKIEAQVKKVAETTLRNHYKRKEEAKQC